MYVPGIINYYNINTCIIDILIYLYVPCVYTALAKRPDELVGP